MDRHGGGSNTAGTRRTTGAEAGPPAWSGGRNRGRSAPPYIKRQIPPYEIASEEGLARIEDTADRILQEIGIEFHDDPRSLELWREAGADVTGRLVRFPKGLVRHVVSTAPRGIHPARAQPPSVPSGSAAATWSSVPSYGSPFVMDMDKGRRYGTIEDFRNFVKLAYSSPWLHHSGGTVCEPTDVPVNKRQPGHGLQPYPLFRPGLPRLHHRGGPGGGFHRDGAAGLRHGTSWSPTASSWAM